MNFLVSSVGGDLGCALVNVLRKSYPNSKIFGTDVSRLGVGIRLVDKFFQSPPGAMDSYCTWITDVVSVNSIKAVIPASDADSAALIHCPSLAAIVVGPGPIAISIAHDKLKTAGHFRDSNLAFPLTYEMSADPPSGTSYIVKPRFGSGSRDVHVCKNKTELETFRILYPDSIIQEKLEPEEAEVTCAVFKSHSGATRVLQLERKLSHGVTVWARVIDDPLINDYCEEIAKSVKLVGAMNVQLIKTTFGPKAFEINARFSSTVEMRDGLGFRDLYWSLEEQIFDRPTFYKQVLAGQTVSRK